MSNKNKLQKMKRTVLLLILLSSVLTNSLGQNQKYQLLISGTVKNIDSTNVYLGLRPFSNQIILNNLTIFFGEYNLSEIKINIPCHIYIGSSNPVSVCPNSSWIGMKVLIEISIRENKYFCFGKGSYKEMQAPALTPDRSAFYFLSVENNLKNGISDNNEKIINAIQKATKTNSIKDESEKLKNMAKIVNDANEYSFIREYYIWELNRLRTRDVCLYEKKKIYIISLIDNKQIPLIIRLKARDFYPNYPDYSKYYQLLYDLQSSNVEGYKNKLIRYTDYYKNEVTKKIEEDESIIKLINQKLNK